MCQTLFFSIVTEHQTNIICVNVSKVNFYQFQTLSFQQHKNIHDNSQPLAPAEGHLLGSTQGNSELSIYHSLCQTSDI
jgi:hypothetical protein